MSAGHRQITKQIGFTLVEIVVVLVILGILGALALARYSDLESETRASTLEGLAGSIRATAAIQHSIARLNQASGGLTNGFIANGVLFDQGYPVALDFDAPGSGFNDGDGTPEILEAMDLDLGDWTFNTIVGGSENGQITRELYVTSRDVLTSAANAQQIINTNCYVSYDSYLLVQIAPVIRTITSGC